MAELAKIYDALKASGLEAMLIMSPENRFYVTGFQATDGGALVLPHNIFFFTDARYIEAARAGCREGVTVGLCSREMPLAGCLSGILRSQGVTKVGAEEDSLSFSQYVGLEKALGVTFSPAQSVLAELRSRKSAAELRKLISAQRIAEAALEDVLYLIRSGVSERELAAELAYRMLRHGAEGNSFPPIVVSGKNSSKPHGVPGDKLIESGDFVTMDFGCVKDGYCSDMTRTVAVGTATDEMKNVYDTVLRSQLAGIAAARPGVTGAYIHSVGAKVIADEGYGEYFTHGFGHGVGVEIHEAPTVSPANETPLPEGAVVSAEPGIYIEGRFGVRIEDVICLTRNGCLDITDAPKDLLIL